jgi:DNA-binding MarR family transcriptional regulator
MSRRGPHMSPGADALPAKASRTNGRAVVRFLDAIDRARLTPIDVLILLHVAEGETTVRDLAERLDRRPADVRRTTDRLVARGLIRRRSDRMAPPGPIFTATASGLDVLAGLEPPSPVAGARQGDGRRQPRRDARHRPLRAARGYRVKAPSEQIHRPR